MITDEKESAMRSQLDDLSNIVDNGGSLNEWEQMAYDIYSWLLDDTDEPSLE